MDDSEKLTVKEAAEILGLAGTTIARVCTQGGYDAVKVGIPGRCRWLLDRKAVEEELAAREEAAQMKARGLRRCASCKKWKPRDQWWRNQVYCKICAADYMRKQRQKKGSHYGSGTPVPGDVGEYVGIARPAEAKDSLKYACMDIGFSHRPLPIVNGKRMSKRAAFCSKCTAPQCMHHPHLEPEEVRILRQVPARPVEDWG